MNKHKFSSINCITLLHYQTLRWILVVLRFISWRVKLRIRVNTQFQHSNSTWILDSNIVTRLEYSISKFWLESSLDKLKTRLNLDDSTRRDQSMQTKIATVTRTLHSLFRLMNSEWKLNVKSEKQLYLTYVTSISNYDVEIWWNNQKSYLVKFRKLQNAALWKILSAFRTSSIDAMQIEVKISSMKIWLNQKCKNYAIWIVELLKKHSIRKRTSITYSSQYSIKLNLDLNASKYLNWNEMKTNVSWKAKKYKDRLTQIYWILNKVQKTLNSIKEIEISHFKKSWEQEIEHLAKLQTEFAKDETCNTINTHYRELERIIKKAKNIAMYTDASQIRKKIAEVETEIETTVIFTHELVRCSKATSVSGKIIITKAKLQAISDAIVMYSEKALKNSEIWVYMNSQMTLQRLNAKSNVNARLFNDIRQNLINLRQKQC